jgi:hypothetical protein
VIGATALGSALRAGPRIDPGIARGMAKNAALFRPASKKLHRLNSTKPAAAPRYAAASVTTAAKNAPAPAAAATAATTASTATAAATAAATSTATTAAATSSAATTTTSTAAAAARYLREAGGAVFPVEEVECSKTYVGYFLFAENEALIGCGVQRLRNVRGGNSGCGCASRQRKTQSGGTQGRHTSGFGQTLPFRNLLHSGHATSSMQVFRFQLKEITFGSCAPQARMSPPARCRMFSSRSC